jgi:hypothetical protein
LLPWQFFSGAHTECSSSLVYQLQLAF